MYYYKRIRSGLNSNSQSKPTKNHFVSEITGGGKTWKNILNINYFASFTTILYKN